MVSMPIEDMLLDLGNEVVGPVAKIARAVSQHPEPASREPWRLRWPTTRAASARRTPGFRARHAPRAAAFWTALMMSSGRKGLGTKRPPSAICSRAGRS